MGPTIEFYYMPESPPCRTVEMVANIIGVNLNKHYINLFTKDQLKDDYVAINPRHKVPFIIDGDLKLSESRAIVAYLVNRYGSEKNKSLYPVDPIERAQVDELLYYDIGTLYPATSALVGPKLFGDVHAPWDTEKEKAYNVALQYLEDRISKRVFMVGNNLTIADIALTASIMFVSSGCDYKIDRYPNLNAYLANIKRAIPDYDKINDEALENTRKFIQSRRADTSS